MIGLSRSRSPTITNVMSKLNTIKANINSLKNQPKTVKANINSLKNQPKTVNSRKNEKIKYLNDQIKERKSHADTYAYWLYDRFNKLREQGKTNDEIQTDKAIVSLFDVTGKMSREVEALEEEKKALVMSGGKTRRNKRKNRKTRKSN